MKSVTMTPVHHLVKLAILLCTLASLLFTTSLSAKQNPPKRQVFPEGSPEQAVEAILFADFITPARQAPEAMSIAYQYWPPIPSRERGDRDWTSCFPTVYVDAFKIVGRVAMPMIGIRESRPDPNTMVIVVQVKVRGLVTGYKPGEKIPSELEWCGWSGLKITNTATGRDEYVLDRRDSKEKQLELMRSFGTALAADPGYVKVPKEKSDWEFGIEMFRDPASGVWRPSAPYHPQHTSVAMARAGSVKALARTRQHLKKHDCASPKSAHATACQRFQESVDSITSLIAILDELAK